MVDAATASGRAERLLLDRLHARAFEYVFVSAGLEPLLRDLPDSAARDDAHAAFESVFPRHAARRFFALPSAERAAALRELASVVVGALAFEARRLRDARYHDPFEEAEAEASAEADDPFRAVSTQKDPLRALRDRAPATRRRTRHAAHVARPPRGAALWPVRGRGRAPRRVRGAEPIAAAQGADGRAE